MTTARTIAHIRAELAAAKADRDAFYAPEFGAGAEIADEMDLRVIGLRDELDDAEAEDAAALATLEQKAA